MQDLYDLFFLLFGWLVVFLSFYSYFLYLTSDTVFKMNNVIAVSLIRSPQEGLQPQQFSFADILMVLFKERDYN